VQAQDFSQACSISIPFCKAASQMLKPVGASMTAPSGQMSSCGKKINFGIAAFIL
jgi:hypothetical protein